MSTPLARTPRAAIGTSAPTRQQLDELDALLQRMLDLPVNHAEEEAEQEEPAEPPRREPAAPVIGSIQPTPTVVPLRAAPREEPASDPPPEPPAEAPRPRAYPASYMVVETNNPFFTQPESPPRDVPPRAADAGLAPPMLHHEEPQAPEQDQPQEEPGDEAEQNSPADPPGLGASALDDTPAEWVPFQSSWQPSEQTWKPLAESWEQARTIPLPAPEPAPEPAPPLSAPPRKKPEAPPTARPPRPALRNPPSVPPPAGPVVTTQTAEAPEVPHVPEAFVRPRSSALPEEFLAPVKPPVPKEPPRDAAHDAAAPGPARSVVLLPLVWFNVVFDVGLTLGGPLGTWLKGKNGRGFLGTIGLLCLVAAIALAVADGIGWTW